MGRPLPTVHSMSQGRTASPEGKRSAASRPAPNYAARRMLVSTISVALVVAAGVLAWRLTRDGSAEAKPETGEWNEVVFVDRTNGAVTSGDRQGSPQARQAANAKDNATHGEGSRQGAVKRVQGGRHETAAGAS